MIKNSSIKDFISLLPMPTLIIDNNGFMIALIQFIPKNLNLIEYQILTRSSCKLFFL